MEHLAENNLAINRAAKKALVSVGEFPWPESLYVLQLVHWALETGRVAAADYLLEEYVETLLYRRTPEWGMRVVLVQVGLTDEEADEGEVPVDYSPGMPAEKFAAAVLSNISLSLQELNPDYLDADRLGYMRGR